MSGMEIDELAAAARKMLGLEDTKRIDIVRVLERIPDLIPGFSKEIMEDHELELHIEAYTDLEEDTIFIRRSVYDGAFYGEGRPRFTLAHELGHYFLMRVFGVRFYSIAPDAELPTYKDPEWQADRFAAEFLAPSHLIVGMTAQGIASTFGLSRSAAEARLRAVQRRQ